MRKNVRSIIMLLLAFSIMLFITGAFAKTAWAADSVTGGVTLTKAAEIKLNKQYRTDLKANEEAYFKLTIPSGDFERMNTWLHAELEDGSYGETFYAFYGEESVVGKSNHTKWRSSSYQQDFPVRCCKPSGTCYLWLLGGTKDRSLTFCMKGDTDDPDEDMATPLTLSGTLNASIDTRPEGKFIDKDQFTIRTKKDGYYKVTVKAGNLTSSNTEYKSFDLDVRVVTDSMPGHFVVKTNSTSSRVFYLYGNDQVDFEVVPYNFTKMNGKVKYDSADYSSMYLPYSIRVETTAEKPKMWERDYDLPEMLKLSKTKTYVWYNYEVFGGQIYYLFKTVKAGNYRIFAERRPWSEEDKNYNTECSLVFDVYDNSEKQTGSFKVRHEKSGSILLNLKKNSLYCIRISPADYYEAPGASYPTINEYCDLRVDPPTELSWGKAKVSFKKTFTYKGKKIKPAVTLVYGGKTLKKGTDYKISYKNNSKPGKGIITITPTGNYCGSAKSFAFSIKPKKQVISSLKSTKAKKVTVNISKDSTVAGWQICYSVKSDFKTFKKKTTAASSRTFTLTSGKTYYFRVRGIAKYGSKKIYGAWSKVKKVTVK